MPLITSEDEEVVSVDKPGVNHLAFKIRETFRHQRGVTFLDGLVVSPKASNLSRSRILACSRTRSRVDSQTSGAHSSRREYNPRIQGSRREPPDRVLERDLGQGNRCESLPAHRHSLGISTRPSPAACSDPQNPHYTKVSFVLLR